MRLVDIRDLFRAILPGAVFHYRADSIKRDKYIVWAEDNQSGASYADNKTKSITLQGTIDYFTKTEYDSLVNTIQKTMNDSKMTWRINSIQYEDDTKYFHHEWVWEVGQSIG